MALSKHEYHSAANAWLSKQTADGSLLFCRSTEQSFLRLLTTDSVMRLYALPPMTNAAAWAVYQGFRSDRRIAFAGEPNGIEPHWVRFAARKNSSPKLWMDAYLAAFAIAGRYALVTTDKGFKQFKGLEPLIVVK